MVGGSDFIFFPRLRQFGIDLQKDFRVKILPERFTVVTSNIIKVQGYLIFTEKNFAHRPNGSKLITNTKSPTANGGFD